jgi:type IV secretory pathway TraG/TraD family ATPase VirD4
METKIHIGKNLDEGGKAWALPSDWLSHFHLTGLTRSGKSSLLLLLCIALIELRKGFLLLDPHGDLYRDVLAELVRRDFKREVVLFDPSNNKRIVGANFFLTDYTDEGQLMTNAERKSKQLTQSFGLQNTDMFGNIERYLRAFFYTILDRKLSICDLLYFLHWEFKNERQKIIDKVSSPEIKAELNDLYSSKVEFERKIGPTKNKLQRFIHPQMKRIMGLTENNVDFKALVEKGRPMLCNLQPSENDLVGSENTRALATLILSEFWENFKKSTKCKEFYVIADEAQNVFTPSLTQILPESAKRGLHLILSHQDLGQLSPELMSAFKNAQTKITFSSEENPKMQRHFTLRRANGEKIECEAPMLQKSYVSPKTIEAFIERNTRHFMTPEQVDERLNKSHNGSNPTQEINDPEDE